MLAGDATEQTPPDLPSYLFKERIVYLVRPCGTFLVGAILIPHPIMQHSSHGAADDLSRVQGMSLVPSVTELIMAELLYLQYDNAVNPINMYINSTGVTVCPSCGLTS